MALSWTIHSEVIELRYENGFRFWDRAGELTQEVTKSVPSLKVKAAEPGQVNLESKNVGLSAVLGMNTSNVNLVKLDGVSKTAFYKTFNPAAKITVDRIISVLDLVELSRLGNRYQFFAPVKDMDDAFAKMEEISKKRNLGNNFFSGITDSRIDKQKYKECTIRFESETIGFYLQLKPFLHKIEIDNIPSILPHLPQPQQMLVFDLDIYTLSPMPTNKLLVEEWLDSNLRLIEARILPLISD